MLQDVADGLSTEGLSPSSVRNTILPLRAIYRRAHSRGEVALNPTLKLSLPAVRGRRDRIAAPAEATALLDALPSTERASTRPRSTPAYAWANSKRRGEERGLSGLWC
jgi:site-specific recombinase XerD